MMLQSVFIFIVMWFHDDRIIRDNAKYSLGASRGKRMLEIKDCHCTDAGMYKCVAESSKGSATSNFTLEITARRRPGSVVTSVQSLDRESSISRRGPTIVGQLHVELRLNGTVHLECTVNNPAEVHRVVWRKDGVPVG